MRPELMDVMGGDLCATAVVHMHPTALCALRATSPRLRTCVEQAAKMICRRMGRRGHRRGTVWCKVLSHMSRAALATQEGHSPAPLCTLVRVLETDLGGTGNVMIAASSWHSAGAHALHVWREPHQGNDLSASMMRRITCINPHRVTHMEIMPTSRCLVTAGVSNNTVVIHTRRLVPAGQFLLTPASYTPHLALARSVDMNTELVDMLPRVSARRNAASADALTIVDSGGHAAVLSIGSGGRSVVVEHSAELGKWCVAAGVQTDGSMVSMHRNGRVVHWDPASGMRCVLTLTPPAWFPPGPHPWFPRIFRWQLPDDGTADGGVLRARRVYPSCVCGVRTESGAIEYVIGTSQGDMIPASISPSRRGGGWALHAARAHDRAGVVRIIQLDDGSLISAGSNGGIRRWSIAVDPVRRTAGFQFIQEMNPGMPMTFQNTSHSGYQSHFLMQGPDGRVWDASGSGRLRVWS